MEKSGDDYQSKNGFFWKNHRFFVEKSEIDITNGKSAYFSKFSVSFNFFEKVDFPLGTCFYQNTHMYNFEMMEKFFILSMEKIMFFSRNLEKVRLDIYGENE